MSRCKANPCCSDPYNCKVPLPQDRTGLYHLNARHEASLKAPQPLLDAPRVSTDGEGWVFLNPDSGTEYSRNHPIESGEAPNAENIRKSTSQEDVLWNAYQTQYQIVLSQSKDISRLSALKSGDAPRVKALEWEHVTDQIPKHAYAAYTGFARWLIVVEFLSMNHAVYRFHDKDYKTLEAAKAAAQADFNARILSALQSDGEGT